MALDSVAVQDAGATAIHLHPRDEQGRESLNTVDDTMLAVRKSCPDALVGVSTGAWIMGDEAPTPLAIAQWKVLPDYTSVNLAERDAPAVMETLRERGVGIEVGLASAKDAERLVGSEIANEFPHPY